MNHRLRDFENFLTACGSRTLTEAAARQNISQPAISESIARLEDELSSKLFYRTRSGLRLTAKGRIYRQKIEGIMNLLHELSEPEKVTFALKIGCHRSVGIYALPLFIKSLSRQIEFTCSLVHDRSKSIQNQVQTGLIDIGLVINPTPSTDLMISHVGVDTMRVYGDLSTNTLICDPELVQTSKILRQLSRQKSKIIHSDSFEVMASLVRQGLGCAILPDRVAHIFMPEVLPAKGTPFHRDRLAVIYRPELRDHGIKAAVDDLKTALLLG